MRKYFGTDGIRRIANTKLDNEPKTGINNPTKFVIGTLICAFIGLGICMKKMSK